MGNLTKSYWLDCTHPALLSAQPIIQNATAYEVIRVVHPIQNATGYEDNSSSSSR